MAESLLSKAQSVNAGKHTIASSEDIELALAWLSGKVTTKQVGTAYGFTQPNNAMYRIASSLRQAHKLGLIKVK